MQAYAVCGKNLILSFRGRFLPEESLCAFGLGIEEGFLAALGMTKTFSCATWGTLANTEYSR
jgi:hypothetical protein